MLISGFNAEHLAKISFPFPVILNREICKNHYSRPIFARLIPGAG
jgi:hypothetical protein